MHFICVCTGDRIIIIGNDCFFFFLLLMAFGGASTQKTLNAAPALSGHTGSISQGPQLSGSGQTRYKAEPHEAFRGARLLCAQPYLTQQGVFLPRSPQTKCRMCHTLSIRAPLILIQSQCCLFSLLASR